MFWEGGKELLRSIRELDLKLHYFYYYYYYCCCCWYYSCCCCNFDLYLYLDLYLYFEISL